MLFCISWLVCCLIRVNACVNDLSLIPCTTHLSLANHFSMYWIKSKKTKQTKTTNERKANKQKPKQQQQTNMHLKKRKKAKRHLLTILLKNMPHTVLLNTKCYIWSNVLPCMVRTLPISTFSILAWTFPIPPFHPCMYGTYLSNSIFFVLPCMVLTFPISTFSVRPYI